MDPISFAASIITLVQTSSKLYQFLQSVRHVDAQYGALSNEVSALTGHLRSINAIFQDCRRHHFALVAIDDAVWNQSSVTIADCQQTIDDLSALVERIGGGRPSRSFLRKTRMTTQMHIHSSEVVSFRDKIHLSTISLQTLLQIITVSLSLRRSTSHDLALRELRVLRQDLEASDRVVRDFDSYSNDRSDRYLVKNLESLLRVARDYHSNASNTATTIYKAGATSCNTKSDMDQAYAESVSVPGATSDKRRQVLSFLQRQERPSRVNSTVIPKTMGLATFSPRSLSSPALEFDEDAPIKLEVEVDNLVSGGLRKTAQKAIREFNMKKAEAILDQTVARYKMTGPEDALHSRLRIQLALCRILQDKQSEELRDFIIDIAEYRGTKRTVADQLLYALALSYMHTLEYRKAEKICSLIGSDSTRSNSSGCPGTTEVSKLLFFSHRLTGQNILADAIAEQLPGLSLDERLPTANIFISGCPELLGELFDTSDLSQTPLLVRSLQDHYEFYTASRLNFNLAQMEKASRKDPETQPTRSQSTWRGSRWMGSRRLFNILNAARNRDYQDENGNRVSSWISGQDCNSRAPSIPTFDDTLDMDESKRWAWMHAQDPNGKAPSVPAFEPRTWGHVRRLESTQARAADTPIMALAQEVPDWPLVTLMDTSPPAELEDTALTPAVIAARFNTSPERSRSRVELLRSRCVSAASRSSQEEPHKSAIPVIVGHRESSSDNPMANFIESPCENPIDAGMLLDNTINNDSHIVALHSDAASHQSSPTHSDHSPRTTRNIPELSSETRIPRLSDKDSGYYSTDTMKIARLLVDFAKSYARGDTGKVNSEAMHRKRNYIRSKQGSPSVIGASRKVASNATRAKRRPEDLEATMPRHQCDSTSTGEVASQSDNDSTISDASGASRIGSHRTSHVCIRLLWP
ncbi:hypothetical protein PG984_016452 [Apiospora sp. TS-2023a]